jgi:hypothetical protein
MQKDFAMFTAQGNAAVEGIVEDAVAKIDNRKDATDWAFRELETLQTLGAYREADDTAVREAVYFALQQAYPEPVFKTVRA